MIYCAHAYWDKRNIFALCKAFRPSQSSIQKGKDLLHKVVMDAAGTSLFFLIQFEFGLMMMGKCVCSFSNIRTEQKIHAMLKKLLSSVLKLVKQML